jgi:hypothetical protein
VFSNRHFGWKLAASLVAIALLGLRSERLGDSIHPNLWRCLAQPARWDGTALWLPRALVVASDADGFEIEVQGVRARVAPADRVAPGDTIALTGTFRASGPIQLKLLRKDPPGDESRRWPVIVSIAVVALAILNLLRHFSFRPKVIQVEGRD